MDDVEIYCFIFDASMEIAQKQPCGSSDKLTQLQYKSIQQLSS